MPTSFEICLLLISSRFLLLLLFLISELPNYLKSPFDNTTQLFKQQNTKTTMQYPPQQIYPQNNTLAELGPNDFNQYNQGYPPQPPMNMNNPVQNQQVDQVLAGGFGDMFFNMNDPRVAQTNVPVKQDSSMHTGTIFGTILMVAGVVVGAIGFRKFLVEYATGLVIGLPYLVYLLIVIFASDIRGYITNLKKFEDYKEIYDSMVAAKGFFIFWIECYHYRQVRTKNGTRREKVVTHTASQRYNPLMCQDVSGNITGIQDITKYVFINYLKKFFFTDNSSQSKFNAAYSNFVSKNRRDQYQNHTQTFDIEGFQEEVGFCALGEAGHNCFLFYFTAFLGLSLIYSCILERSVSRYSINIVKKLTC